MSNPRGSKPTCGPLYLAALKRYATTPAEERLFAAGFVYGEAEKIYLGACHGAMFRPSAEAHSWLNDVVMEAAEHYGLLFRPLPTSRGEELWLLSTSAEAEYLFDVCKGSVENRESDRRASKRGLVHQQERPRISNPLDAGSSPAEPFTITW